MQPPLLTIILPNYNYGRYLGKAIDSVIHENFAPFELLIIEDGSTDNSREIVERYAKKYPFIRVIWHEKNQGLFPSFDEGIHEARGKYIHLLASDDFRCPGFIEKTMGILTKNPDVGLCCSDFGYVRFAENPTKIHTSKLFSRVKAPIIFQAVKMVKVFQNSSFWVPGSSTIVKKELFIKYGKFNPDLKFFCDLYLYYFIGINESVAYIPETLSAIVYHNETYTIGAGGKDIEVHKQIYKYLMASLFLKENKKMKNDFMKSTVLRGAFDALGKRNFIFKVKYWPFFYYFFMKFFRKALRKIIFKRFNPLSLQQNHQ